MCSFSRPLEVQVFSEQSFSIRRRILSQICNKNFINVTGRTKGNGNQFAHSVSSLKQKCTTEKQRVLSVTSSQRHAGNGKGKTGRLPCYPWGSHCMSVKIARNLERFSVSLWCMNITQFDFYSVLKIFTPFLITLY